MALKLKIDEETFKALKAPFQAEYKKADDGTYSLDVEGMEDTGALKRAKEHEKELHKSTRDKLKEAEARYAELNTQMEELRAEKIRGGDKVAETEKAWQAKLTKREAELKAEVEGMSKALRSQMEDSVATSIAAELAGENAELLLPHISRRLRAEIVDGKAVTKIIGADGEVSAMTLDELKKEVLTSPRFSAVVVGSKASGGGTAGARKGAGGTQRKSLKEMTATEEAIFANQNPAEYKQMMEAAGLS